MKQQIYLVVLAIISLLMAACASTETPQYFQKNFSQPAPVEKPLRCVIGNTTYYERSFFIYHVTSLGDRVVYSPVGTYTKPENYSRWQFTTYLDKNDSLYNKTSQYIDDRRLPNGQPVDCAPVDKVPVDFRNFVVDHEKLFKANLNNSNELVI
jgi:hypothetical protein